MHQQLKERLWAFIVHNNPELMFNLQEGYNVTKYLEEKVSTIMPKALDLLAENKAGHAIIELCMEEMTKDLRPSKYHYIKSILSNEFPRVYESLKESGLLTYETVNIVDLCAPLFDQFSFSEENRTDEVLRYTISGAVDAYLKGIN